MGSVSLEMVLGEAEEMGKPKLASESVSLAL